MAIPPHASHCTTSVRNITYALALKWNVSLEICLMQHLFKKFDQNAIEKRKRKRNNTQKWENMRKINAPLDLRRNFLMLPSNGEMRVKKEERDVFVSWFDGLKIYIPSVYPSSMWHRNWFDQSDWSGEQKSYDYTSMLCNVRKSN